MSWGGTGVHFYVLFRCDKKATPINQQAVVNKRWFRSGSQILQAYEFEYRKSSCNCTVGCIPNFAYCGPTQLSTNSYGWILNLELLFARNSSDVHRGSGNGVSAKKNKKTKASWDDKG